MQRYKVENILERIIEKKNIKKLKLDIDLYPYVEYMAYRLRTYGKKNGRLSKNFGRASRKRWNATYRGYKQRTF